MEGREKTAAKEAKEKTRLCRGIFQGITPASNGVN